MKGMLIVLLMTATVAAHGAVYKCTDAKGKTTFSDRPCGNNAEEVTVEDTSGGLGLLGPGGMEKVIADNRKRDLERAIKRHEDAIQYLHNERERRLNELRVKQSYANNNLAGATYRQSIATEMQAVSEDYNARIDAERDAIQRLQNQK